MMNSDYKEPINIGSEEIISMNGLAKLVASLANKNIEIKNIPGPQGVRGRTMAVGEEGGGRAFVDTEGSRRLHQQHIRISTNGGGCNGFLLKATLFTSSWQAGRTANRDPHTSLRRTWRKWPGDKAASAGAGANNSRERASTWIYQLRWRRDCKPSFSVTSAADMALGKSCLLQNTSKTASRSSSSFNMRCNSSRASPTRSLRIHIQTTARGGIYKQPHNKKSSSMPGKYHKWHTMQ